MTKLQRITGIEIVAIILFIVALSMFFLYQKQTLDSIHRDQTRKRAINAVHRNLEEVILPSLKGYPRTLSGAQLSTIPNAELVDPNGLRVNERGSDYRYAPSGCNGTDVCSSYTLSARLERESDFVRTNE